MKIQKKIWGGVRFGGGGGSGWWGGGGGVRVDVNEELKCERRIEVFEKIHKKNRGGGGVGVFVLGVFGLGGQGGCERRIEVFCEN